MYQRKTNNISHKKYSIEEKNQIVLLYLDRHMGVSQILRTYDLADANVLKRWVKKYQDCGTVYETRGHTLKSENPKKGRQRKVPERKLEDYSKEELIERCRMLEDIKKSMVYLRNQKRKKNIK